MEREKKSNRSDRIGTKRKNCVCKLRIEGKEEVKEIMAAIHGILAFIPATASLREMSLNEYIYIYISNKSKEVEFICWLMRLLHINSYLSPPPSLDLLSAVAFPSRTAIAAFLATTDDIPPPVRGRRVVHRRRARQGLRAIWRQFLSQALSRPSPSKNSDTFDRNSDRVGSITRRRRRSEGTVPVLLGLIEPPVVPDCLGELGANNWFLVQWVDVEEEAGFN